MTFFIVACIVLFGTYLTAIGVHQVTGRKHKEIEAFDADGHRIGFDAHYTRNLEVETGVKVDTKCDDPECNKCVWKLRRKRSKPNYAASTNMLWERDEFIDSLDDSMSDAYNQMLLDEFEAEQEKTVAEKELAERFRETESYYATPIEQIQRLSDEGYSYNKSSNTWIKTMDSGITFYSNGENVDASLKALEKWQKAQAMTISELRNEIRNHKDSWNVDRRWDW